MTENYFVELSNPKDLRLLLLNNAKLALTSSVQYFDLLKIQEEKSLLIQKLKSELEDINSSFLELDSILPYQELLTQAKSVKRSTVKKSVELKEDLKIVAKSSEKVDKLKEALEAIEAKLNSLS